MPARIFTKLNNKQGSREIGYLLRSKTQIKLLEVKCERTDPSSVLFLFLGLKQIHVGKRYSV